LSSHSVDLSVIVPAFNEAKRLPSTLRRFHQYLASNSFTYEILVIMDGCSDNTREIVASLSAEVSNLRIIDRPENRGKGYTVKEGMLRAAGRVRLFCDADNSTDIAHFDKMIPLFDRGFDVVIASRNSRDAAGAEQAVPQAWLKRIIGQFGNLFVQLVAVRGIWDTQCGFKAFCAEATERIFSQSKIDGWGFDIEILTLARALRLKIGIIPARWINDDRSHFRPFDYARVVGDTLRVRSNLLAGKYEL
jgi:glycosyltransferase involved in cell wall biosynthesis